MIHVKSLQLFCLHLAQVHSWLADHPQYMLHMPSWSAADGLQQPC